MVSEDAQVAEFVETMRAAREASAVLGFVILKRPIPAALTERAAKLRENGHIDDAGITDRGHDLWSKLLEVNLDPISDAKYIRWDPDQEIIYPFQEQEDT